MSRKKRRRAQQPPEQLRAATAPYPPGQSSGYGGISFLPHPMFHRVGRIVINEETCLQYATCWACVKVISEDIAGLPWHVLRRRADGGKDEDFTHAIDWLLDVQASPEVSAFQFRESIISHALIWGNGYAEIERDALGRPVWLHLLTPDRVCPERNEFGQVVYKVENYRGPPTYLPSSDVFHLKGLGYDGLVGYGVIRLAARCIAIGMSQDEFSSTFYANDATPGGIIEHPGRLSDRARDNITKAWERRHMGVDKQRRIAVLEENMKFHQTGLPPEAAQLSESKHFQPVEICRFFRISPVKVQILDRSTFNNIEHLSLDHVTDCLMPWVRRLELEADIKLFGQKQRGAYVTKVNVSKRLRGDSASQANFVTQLISWGIISHDDARKFLDYNPIPDGKKHFVPVNMQLLEKAVDPEEPPPPGQAAPPGVAAGEEEPQGGEAQGAETNGDTSRLRAAFRPLFLDAFGRIAQRVKNEVGNRKAHHPGDWREKLGAFWEKMDGYARGQLAAPLLTLHALTGRRAPHIDDLSGLKELAEQDDPDWGGWAGRQADALLALAFDPDQPRDEDGRFGSGGWWFVG